MSIVGRTVLLFSLSTQSNDSIQIARQTHLKNLSQKTIVFTSSHIVSSFHTKTVHYLNDTRTHCTLYAACVYSTLCTQFTYFGICIIDDANRRISHSMLHMHHDSFHHCDNVKQKNFFQFSYFLTKFSFIIQDMLTFL